MMTSKFASILEVSSTLHSLSNNQFVKTFEQLLETDEKHKPTIIFAIFRNFYDDCPPNDKLLEDLLKILGKLPQQKTNRKQQGTNNVNQFDKLPDSLFSNIASYLPSKDIFSKWNNVNHRFIQIGLKPESIMHFEFKNCDDFDTRYDGSAQFDLDTTLSKLELVENREESIFCDCDDDDHDTSIEYLVEQISIKHTKSLHLGMCLVCLFVY